MISQKLTIVSKETLAPGVYLFCMSMQKPVTFFPGQFVVLMIGPKIFRSYSIVDVSGGDEPAISFIIDVRVGGPASQFFEHSKEGTTLELIGNPLGKFIVHDNGLPKVFVATGTGIAPFIPMIKAVLRGNPHADVSLFFGARHEDEDYSERFFEDFSDVLTYQHFRIHHCISKPKGEPGFRRHSGRVTDVVPSIITEYRDTDFYLCGNPAMVDDMKQILAQKGADKNIHTEKYGK